MFKVIAEYVDGTVVEVQNGIDDYKKAWEVAKAYMQKVGLKIKFVKVEKDEKNVCNEEG